ncbi:MAG: chemotaxis-specific protein-glutamate methyltransferase CheB [Ruminococcus sp.]|jgi:two-component system chemotaxis response regulator CheB|nr:chemotaxis-specific protein-glutamate methyltransferase CheB [Ruminococcus sp.]
MPIKVMVVDDSVMFRAVIRKGLADRNDIQIIAEACDAFDAMRMLHDLNPDVMILDINMPRMDGTKFLAQLMSATPKPVIMVTAGNTREQDVMSAGAAGFLKKPASLTETKQFMEALASKVIYASKFKPKLRAMPQIDGITVPPERKFSKVAPRMPGLTDIGGLTKRANDGYIVALGASTGGTEALECVLQAFPKNMPPVVVVQHMPPVFTKMYAERLDRSCQIEVKEAENNDKLIPGRCLIAPGGLQFGIKKDGFGGFLCYVKEGEKVSGHCPSVDNMFMSAAEVNAPKTIAALLTGMGADGAKGLLKLRQMGGYTIGQDEATSVVYGMPMEAFKLGGCREQQPLDNIGRQICNILSAGWQHRG